MLSQVVVDETNRTRQFAYAFDCGSVNREHLEQGLSTCSAGVLDLLFISHLDADHVNGVDALTARMQVDAVVLPCLDALQITAIACEAIDDAGVRGTIREFIKNPALWFSERGVKRIFYIRRDGGDGTVPPFIPNPDGLPNDPMRISTRDERLSYAIYSNRVSVAKGPKAAGVEVLTLGEDIAFATDVGTVPAGLPFWVLIPYVHPFSPDDLGVFRRAVSDLIRVPDSSDVAASTFTRRLLAILSDETMRKQLKVCYHILSSDNNKPSLSLYAGPYLFGSSSQGRRIHVSSTDDRFWPHHHEAGLRVPPRSSYSTDQLAAWLTTGDSNLSGSSTRSAWMNRYGKLLDTVRVFVLPHHGSNSSLHDDVIDRLDHAIMVACAASDREHHPHPRLLRRIDSFGNAVWQVSENPDTDYSLNVTFKI